MMYGNELYHHGIKGQKWGVRRFQNRDGSRTSKGLEHLKEDRKDWPSGKKTYKKIIDDSDYKNNKQNNLSNKNQNKQPLFDSETKKMLRDAAINFGVNLAVSYGANHLSKAAISGGKKILLKQLSKSNTPLDVAMSNKNTINAGTKAAETIFKIGIAPVKTGAQIAKVGTRVAGTGLQMAKSVV